VSPNLFAAPTHPASDLLQRLLLLLLAAAPLARFQAGCAAEPALDDGSLELGPVEATVSEHVHTVVTVTWDSNKPCLGEVHYGLGTDYAWRSRGETEPGTEHRQVLVGLIADTEYHFRAACTTDAESAFSADGVVATGQLPASVPELAVNPDSLGSASGFYVVATLQFLDPELPGPPVLIVDPDGNVVWYTAVPTGSVAMRARVSHDGESVLFNVGGANTSQAQPLTYIRRVSWDGSTVEDISLPYLHHDWVELPDGRVAGLTRQFEELSPGAWVAWEQIEEVSRDGTHEVLFSGKEHFEAFGQPVVTYSQPPEFTGQPHANTLTYHAADDSYYLNAISTYSPEDVPRRAYYRFERASRTIAWIMGGPNNMFELGGEAELPWIVGHGVDPTEDSIVVFANDSPDDLCSRAVEVRYDTETWTAEPIWSYGGDECLYTPALGDTQRLSNGNTVVVWSIRGKLAEVTPSGDPQFELLLPFGYAFGLGEMVEDLRLSR
jgi:hypothetical protein